MDIGLYALNCVPDFYPAVASNHYTYPGGMARRVNLGD